MAEGFSNPVANAAGTLVRAVMKSVNFVKGSLGWQITREGDAEFNDATIRGALQVGNPPSQGAQQFGLTGTEIPAVLRNFSADYQWFAASISWTDTVQFWFSALVRNVPGNVVEQITGVYTTANGVQIQTLVELESANILNHGSSLYDTAGLVETWRNSTVIMDNTTTLEVDGTAEFTAAVVSEDIDYTGPEVWHPLSLSGGWTNFGSGFVNAQYRRVASPPRSVEVIGVITGGTSANATVIGILPFTPHSRQRNNIYAFGSSMNLTTEVPAVDVATTGTINLLGSVNATILSFHFTVSLDA